MNYCDGKSIRWRTAARPCNAVESNNLTLKCVGSRWVTLNSLNRIYYTPTVHFSVSFISPKEMDTRRVVATLSGQCHGIEWHLINSIIFQRLWRNVRQILWDSWRFRLIFEDFCGILWDSEYFYRISWDSIVLFEDLNGISWDSCRILYDFMWFFEILFDFWGFLQDFMGFYCIIWGFWCNSLRFGWFWLDSRQWIERK